MHRRLTARIIAFSVVALGLPFATIILLAGALNPLILLIFTPGWLAYFAPIRTVVDGRLPGDPFTTWISCIAVNGFWIWGINLKFFASLSDKTHDRDIIRTYACGAVVLALTGLLVELSPPLPVARLFSRFRKWLNSW